MSGSSTEMLPLKSTSMWAKSSTVLSTCPLHSPRRVVPVGICSPTINTTKSVAQSVARRHRMNEILSAAFTPHLRRACSNAGRSNETWSHARRCVSIIAIFCCGATEIVCINVQACRCGLSWSNVHFKKTYGTNLAFDCKQKV